MTVGAWRSGHLASVALADDLGVQERRLTLIRPPGVKKTNFPLGLEKKKEVTNFSQDHRRYRFGAVPVSDLVSKRVTDLGLHQTLIEAQWCG